ncbi:MAG: hypothetical protein GXY55_16180 [Phycisphaerae bacterium]|nr:hypothetical protein [Phycisphaerae bacterium]
MTDVDCIRPGRWLYGLAAALLVVGFIVAAGCTISMIRMIMQAGEGFTRIVVPGEGVVQVDEPVTLTIYHEYSGWVDGQTYSNPKNLPTLKVAVTGPDGQPVPVQAGGANETYTMGAREGVALSRFDASQTGEYRVAGSLSADVAEQTVIAVGESFLGRLLGTILMTTLGAVFGGLCCLAATIVFLVTIIKRSSARRRLAASTPSTPV